MWQHYYYWHSRRFTPHLPLFAHGRCTVLVTTGPGSLIVRIIAYHSGDYALKIQGFIGIVALQGSSGSTATVFIRWPYPFVWQPKPQLAGGYSRVCDRWDMGDKYYFVFNAVNRAGASKSREVRGPLLVEVLAARRRDSLHTFDQVLRIQ